MNIDDIIRTAKEAGFDDFSIGVRLELLERFANLVASAERERLTDAAIKAAEKAVDVAIALEREACAKVCEEGEFMTFGCVAAAIRARGDKHD